MIFSSVSTGNPTNLFVGRSSGKEMGKRILIENRACGKGKIIFGWFLILVGIFAAFKAIMLGIFFLFIGLLLIITGKIQHWYWNA